MRGVKNGSVNDHSSDCKEIIPSTNSLRWLTAIDIALLQATTANIGSFFSMLKCHKTPLNKTLGLKVWSVLKNSGIFLSDGH